MSLRDRCRDFNSQQRQNAILRQGDPVQDLMDFVHAEMGRAADKRLEDTWPLVFYPPTETDREEIIAAFRDAYPGAVMKKMPGG